MTKQNRFHAEPLSEDEYEKEEYEAARPRLLPLTPENRCSAGHGHADLKWSMERWRRIVPAMNRLAGHFGRLLVLLVFLAAAWLLYDRLKEYTFWQVREAIAAMPTWHIVAASLLSVLNYVILIGYDWLAVRWVGEKDLPLRKIALASFAGYAFSYNFGATLFGTSIRYRLYSAWGVPLLTIVKLLVILGLTFWFGVFALAGVVFIVAPFSIPAGLNQVKLPFGQTFWMGVALLLIALGYVGLDALYYRRSLRFFLRRQPLAISHGRQQVAD